MNKSDLKHVAVIPDGNRRWAEERGLATWRGHQEGAKRLKEVLEKSLDLEIPYFSFWGSSYDNLQKRKPEEVKHLLKLFEKRFKDLLNEDKLVQKQVRVRVLGFLRNIFPDKLCRLIKKLLKKTENFNNYHFTLLLAYNGDKEMLRAIRKLKKDEIEAEDIDSSSVKQRLFTSELPPVDYIVRTGGNPHNSAGFMMWDVANAQYYFTDSYWPDFGKQEFQEAVEEYKKRERRFGA